MITWLSVRNLAIVEELAIEPGAGLNVLTGETGAGKSLLIDSLGFLSGARGSTAMIRGGEEKMIAEAVFHLPRSMQRDLEAAGLECEPANGELEMIVRREIAEGGRSRVQLNGSVTTVRQLSTAMDRLLEIHGQDESLDRIAGQSFRAVLDQFAGHGTLADETRALYEEWTSVAAELEALSGAQRDRELRLDLLAYQISEISAARLEAGEEEVLREERSVLANAQALLEATAGAHGLVSDSEESAIALVGRASQMLAPLARLIGEVRAAHEELEEARIRLQEAARSVAGIADSVRHDPARLEQVEERLALIERLRRKYGDSIERVLAHLESIRSEHDRLADYESSLESLRSREERAFAAYRERAERLSAGRAGAARRLRQAIELELRDLAMAATSIDVRVGTVSSAGSRLVLDDEPLAFGPEGWDRIEIWIAANRGEELRPIQKAASGGELSRIQLAIAAALFRDSERTAGATLVFDEIDAGIGGRVADAVGARLRELARRNQVICVTHLPQIASFASTHFRVWKEEVGARTRARVERLDDREARVDEIARMLGGSGSSEAAREHARELLERGSAPPPRTRKRSAARAVSQLE
ncbi:MAG TPA: DNA repair protein RecN [Thermoanaerobaculia bacterium]|nr:DNA repair protein RecN [Thermoanaerobaculia bacterium]